MAVTIQAEAGHVALRDVFGAEILRIGERDSRVMMLDADLASSTRTAKFAERWPERAINVGIAEQNMTGIAAGLALAGYVPFVNTFASFLSRRACDQVAMSVAYPRLNVKFFGFHGGINLGEDGATQQAVEDIAIMSAIPGIRIYSPVDGHDLARTMNEVLAVDGPTYVRLARFPSPLFTPRPDDREHAASLITMREGDAAIVVTTGTLAAKVAEAADVLAAGGVRLKVVGVTRLKPLSKELCALIASEPRRPVAVVEEHSMHGGLADLLSCELDRRGIAHLIHRIGIDDRFGESGHPQKLLEAFGLAGAPLCQRLRSIAGC